MKNLAILANVAPTKHSEPKNQRLDWCRLGLLQNIRPLAFTNAAIPILMLAQTTAYIRLRRSCRTVDWEVQNRKHG